MQRALRLKITPTPRQCLFCCVAYGLNEKLKAAFASLFSLLREKTGGNAAFCTVIYYTRATFAPFVAVLWRTFAKVFIAQVFWTFTCSHGALLNTLCGFTQYTNHDNSLHVILCTSL